MRTAVTNILSTINKEFLTEPTEAVRINNLPCYVGSITWIHGLSGTGKSYQTAELVGSDINENDLVIYFDGEAGNGKIFKEFVENKGIVYAKSTNVSLSDILTSLIKTRERFSEKNVIFIIDSFSSIFRFTEINNSEKFVSKMYEFSSFVEKHNLSCIIIDHSTRTNEMLSDKKFKLEGNEEGKKRIANVVLRYEPTDYKKPQHGGSFIVEKSRDITLQIGGKITVSSKIALLNQIRDHIVEINEKTYNFDLQKIKKSDLTRNLLKHKQEYKEYIYELFDVISNGRPEILKLKQ